MNNDTPALTLPQRLNSLIDSIKMTARVGRSKAIDIVSQKLHRPDGGLYSRKQIYNWLNETSTPPIEAAITDQLVALAASVKSTMPPQPRELPGNIENYLFDKYFDYAKIFRELKRENTELKLEQENLRLRVEALEELNRLLKLFYQNQK